MCIRDRAEVDEIFELDLIGRWRDEPVRVLDSDGSSVRLLLPDPEPDRARAVGATEVSPGVWQVIGDRSELTDISALTRTAG